MGKVVKTVLKVAAVAAIAYFAPPLAASIGGSVGITSALGTTALAAGIGAGMGKLIPGVSTTQGMFAGGFAGAGQSGLFGGASPTATATGGAGAPTASTTFEQAFSPEYMSSLGSETAGTVPTAVSPQRIGQALSGAAAKPTSVLTSGVGNLTRGIGGALGAVGAGGAGGGLNLGALAPQLLGSALTSTPGAGLMRAQQAELQRAQQVNAALTQQRLEQANQLIADAAYYDPEYMARQAAEAAMIKGGIAAAEDTRGLTGERLAAERRRYRLGTARSAGTAYQQGYGTGVGDRTKTRLAGIQALPTEYPTTTSESSQALRDRIAAQEARAVQQRGIANLFGSVLNQPTQLGALVPGVDDMIASNPGIF